MAVYSIKDLEKLSGIKAHTLRIWEKRYHIIQPRRTLTNIRYYMDEDLKLLLNVAYLNKNGHKISKIAEMSHEEIANLVADSAEGNQEHDLQLDSLTISMIEMDEFKFERIIAQNIHQIGFERTMMEVIFPFLDKLSVLWITGSISPVQENYIAYLIRQKIFVAIDKEPLIQDSKQKKFILYLPGGETQELSLLFMHYIIKSRGFQVINIGQHISLDDLRQAVEIHKPDYIFTILNEQHKTPLEDYLQELSAIAQQAQLLLSGFQVVYQHVKSGKSIRTFQNLMEIIQYLEHIYEQNPVKFPSSPPNSGSKEG